MSKELKPCPFCSSWAHAAHHTARNKDDDYYLVMCSRCFARTVGNTVDEAIAAWNRRVEKRGKWVAEQKDAEYCEFTCSECDCSAGQTDQFDETEVKDFCEWYRFCPNCGAKMEDKP